MLFVMAIVVRVKVVLPAGLMPVARTRIALLAAKSLPSHGVIDLFFDGGNLQWGLMGPLQGGV